MASRRASLPPRPLALTTHDRTWLALTARDRKLLAFAAEHRIVLAAQLARLVGCSESAARRRLGTLRDGGLVTDTRPLRHAPTAWAITRAGLRAIGSPYGRPPELDLGAYRHDVGVGWLAAAAHAGRFGELAEIISERRMRSENARAGGSAARASGGSGVSGTGSTPHGVRIGGGWRPGPRLHYPDLVLVTPAGHRIAVELELTTKTPRRREHILAAYAVDPSIDAVLYFVDRPAAGQAIARSAARVGATGKLRIQRCAWAGGRPAERPAAPGRDRIPGRSAARRRSPAGAAPDRSSPGAER